jgi:hypothetical protein
MEKRAWCSEDFLSAVGGYGTHLGYYTGISAAEGGMVVLGKADNDRWYPMGGGFSVPLEHERNYHLRANVRDGHFQVLVDDMATPVVVYVCDLGYAPLWESKDGW